MGEHRGRRSMRVSHGALPSMSHNPDPHGRAALMLCEGLVLLLVETGVIGRDEAAVIDGLVEVQQEIAAGGESTITGVAALALLGIVARSVSAATDPLATPRTT